MPSRVYVRRVISLVLANSDSQALKPDSSLTVKEVGSMQNFSRL